MKIGKRKYNGEEVDYKQLQEKEEYYIHVFKKQPVQDQWEISVDICEGRLLGKKMNIYGDSEIERRLHRHHEYKIKMKAVFSHHVNIYKTIKEVRNTKKNDD